MKTCPKCGETYADKDLNFCYNDGELLSYLARDTRPSAYADRPDRNNEPPATEFMHAPRITDESIRTPPHAPPAVWPGDQQTIIQLPYSQYPTTVQQNQTLAIVSLALGLGSLTVGWCCSAGLLLAPASIIIGFISLSQIKSDPGRNGGRPFAIAGILTSGIFLALYLLFIIIYGLAVIGGGLIGG